MSTLPHVPRSHMLICTSTCSCPPPPHPTLLPHLLICTSRYGGKEPKRVRLAAVVRRPPSAALR